ncbi:MAG: DUF4124 domain-containing protein [Gammaproteobacteria bacterium]|nr:MAG: DUF4124 domain-containing protein [Gammaproteobacteria bacterium]
MTKTPAILLLTSLLASTPLLADTIYKITDADGKVSYSDSKPENPGDAKVEAITPQPDQNIIKPDVEMNRWLEQKRRTEEPVRKQQQKSWQAEYDEAKAALKAAEAALAAGKEPQEGDFVGIANRFGGSSGARPTEEYLERLEALETAVTEAKKHLKDVESRRPR